MSPGPNDYLSFLDFQYSSRGAVYGILFSDPIFVNSIIWVDTATGLFYRETVTNGIKNMQQVTLP